MAKRSQVEKAEILRSLHTGGYLLVLPNVWNPIGARILESKGFPAVATASAALSASLGYADGEKLSRSTLIECVGRIARSVDVPVTADIEAGYGASVTDLEETIRLVIDAGVVGVNLEDSMKEEGVLRPVDQQRERLAAARRIADGMGIPLVINARVDCFLSPSFPEKGAALEESASRARAYAAAGADCIYPIGPGDADTVRALRERIPYPINILVSPGAAPISILRNLGVNRVSFGSSVFRACLRTFIEIVDEVSAGGSNEWLGQVVPGDQVSGFLMDGEEGRPP